MWYGYLILSIRIWIVCIINSNFISHKISKKKNIVNDEQIIKIIRDELNRDNFDSFELKSIVAINKPNITSVIVGVGYQEIALEISNDSGKIISKEKIAR